MSKAQKHDCQARLNVVCNNQCVTKVTGPKKSDPVFHCCIACRFYLQRQGVKLKDAK